MACEKCEQAQEKPTSAFYRWKTANIEVRGCDEHLRELFDALNKVQEEQRNVILVTRQP